MAKVAFRFGCAKQSINLERCLFNNYVDKMRGGGGHMGKLIKGGNHIPFSFDFKLVVTEEFIV